MKKPTRVASKPGPAAFTLLMFAFFLGAQALVITSEFVLNVPPNDLAAFVLLLGLFIGVITIVRIRTGWSARKLALSGLGLLAAATFVGMAAARVTQTSKPFVEWRQDRVMGQVDQYATGAGFTALVAPDQQVDDGPWPVRRVDDPAGFELAYLSSLTLAEHASGPLTSEQLRDLIAPGAQIIPTSDRTIPADAAYQEFTVRGQPSVGAAWTVTNPDGYTWSENLLVTAVAGVLVRVRQEGNLADSVAIAESLVPLA